MKYYEVTITETLKMGVAVEAVSAWEARDMVTMQWYDREHVLTANERTDVNFKVRLLQ